MNYTEEQNKAINTIEKNLQIIACAGSGKTGAVTERIVNILKSKPDIKPENIVAFTFTDKAAGELKSRINQKIKDQIGELNGLAEMYVGTIHSFCFNLLKSYFAKYQKYLVLDEVKTKLFVDKHFYDIGINHVKKLKDDKPLAQFKDTELFLSMIDIIRESDTNTDNITESIKNAITNYYTIFDQFHFFDFTMIMEKAIYHIKNDDSLRKKLKERIHYLTIDEYQDINPIQEKLIKELYSLGLNICVVGDDDQTIYQWRGSDITNILTFKDRYDIDEPVYFVDNFRSSKGITDLARKVIINNEKRFSKDIINSSNVQFESGDITYKAFTDITDEFNFIAKRVESSMKEDLTTLILLYY